MSRASRRRVALAEQTLQRAFRPIVEQLETRVMLSQVIPWLAGWVPEGPAPLVNDTNVMVPGSLTSGAVNALGVHPFNPNIVFAGTVNGGVWRTTTAQESRNLVDWEPVTA